MPGTGPDGGPRRKAKMGIARLTLKRFSSLSLMLPLSHVTRVLVEGKDEETRRLAAFTHHERGCRLFSADDPVMDADFDLLLTASPPETSRLSHWASLLKPGGVAATIHPVDPSGKPTPENGWEDALDYPALRTSRAGTRSLIRGFRKPGEIPVEMREGVDRLGISLVVPAFNEERYLGRMLESAAAAVEHLVADQGVEGEIIVADNSSTDRTASIASDAGVILTREPKRQIAAARNNGARLARGDILVFSDADNILSENLLTSIYKAMKTDRYVGGGVTVKMEKGSLFGNLVQTVFNILSRITGYSGGVIYTQRERFFRLGGFNEHFFTNEDGLLIQELAREKKRYGLEYHTVKDAWIITSNRKFVEADVFDMLRQSRELATGKRDPRKKEDCSIWYERE